MHKYLRTGAQETGDDDLAPGKETGWQAERRGKGSSHRTRSLSYLLISESGECITSSKYTFNKKFKELIFQQRAKIDNGHFFSL